LAQQTSNFKNGEDLHNPVARGPYGVRDDIRSGEIMETKSSELKADAGTSTPPQQASNIRLEPFPRLLAPTFPLSLSADNHNIQ
jgi:hypothetical protein